MRIAKFLFVSNGHSYETVLTEFQGNLFAPSGYVRVSEFVDVDFPPIPDLIDAQIESLETARTKAEQAYVEHLKEIDERRSALLAAAGRI